MEVHDADNSKQSTADMTAFVQNLLQQMQTRFQTMSESIIGKNILQSINDLRAEMVQEVTTPSPSAPKEESKSAEDN
ncbi:hypothetical protein ACJIZ3_018175 [Penstemon smallii]|uniref:Heat shock factor binding protein n=1 Tax=Penstemon smallii TaxID=265156 RepID=A0ABD3SY50_9LAMI